MTLLLLVVYRLGAHLPIPFLDTDALAAHNLGFSVRSSGDSESFSVLMLGLMPYVSAYVLVELLSLVVPFLKRFRQGGLAGRRSLKRIALVLALLLAVVQARSIIQSLEGWVLDGARPVLSSVGDAQQALLVAILVMGSFGLVGLCELISGYGVGHGISVVALTGLCAQFGGRLPMLAERFSHYETGTFIIAALFFSICTAMALVLLNTRVGIRCTHAKLDKQVAYFQLNLCPSSAEALTYASTLTMLPLTLVGAFGRQAAFLEEVNPGSFWYSALTVITVAVLSYLFGWAFLHPRRRLKKMHAWGWRLGEPGENSAAALFKKQLVLNLPWTVFLCLMAVAPSLLISWADVPFYIGGRNLFVLTAVCLDLAAFFHLSARPVPAPVKIAEYHDVYDAVMIKNHLSAAGIPCCLRGYHHRLLSYFLGPHIEISLLVDRADHARARAVIATFYGGSGLAA